MQLCCESTAASAIVMLVLSMVRCKQRCGLTLSPCNPLLHVLSGFLPCRYMLKLIESRHAPTGTTRFGLVIKPVHVLPQDVHVHVQRELTVLDQPMSTVGDVAMGLEVTFLNSAVDSVGERPT